MTASSSRELKRTIGVTGATATLVGYVVGASIFILPGELAPSTGPAVFVAFLLASLPALFSCFVTAQLGCAYPVSGAAYVAASRLFSPFWGFMVVWSLLVGVTVGIALIAYGFTDYLLFFFPGLDRQLTAVGSVIFFAAINLLGARLSVGTQSLMVAIFIGALALFGIGGLPRVRVENLFPLFPKGLSPVAVAAIPAYFSFIGFFMIGDLAEEIKQPARTIPRALLLSFGAVLFFYLLVPLVLVGILPYGDLAGEAAPLATAAGRFLPRGVARVIPLGALLAGATSLNGILLAVSRDVFALARDKIFPSIFGHLSARASSPDVAILAVTAFGLGGVLIGTRITDYAVTAVSAIMLVQILSAFAVFVLPGRDPERFQKAAYRLSPWSRVVSSVGLALFSLIFILLGLAQSAISSVIFAGSIGIGTAYYLMRRSLLRRRGLSMNEVLRKDLALTPASE